MKCRIFGDIHIRKERPFYDVVKKVLDKAGEGMESGDKLIFLGDFFHTSRPYPEEVNLARRYLSKWNDKGISVSILAGNHEYHGTRLTFAEEVLTSDDAFFYDEPFMEECVQLDACFLYLPWMSKQTLNKMGYESMKDYYENPSTYDRLKNVPKGWTIYALYHFEDETVFTGLDKMGVNLKVLDEVFPDNDVVRVGGHIHIQSSNYLGVPYATRKDESGQDFQYLEIGYVGHQYIQLPNFLQFMEVEYDNLNSIDFDESIEFILDVKSAPSPEDVFAFARSHKNVTVGNYSLRFSETRTVNKDGKEQKASIREYLESFIKENKIDADTSNYILSVFKG